MKIVLRDSKAFFAGLTYFITGSIAFVLSLRYDVGSALRMGPGYFPAMLSALLTCLGLASIVQGVRAKTVEKISKRDVEPIVLIVLGVLSFAFLIERAGLFLALAVLIFFSCFRRLLSNPIEIILLYLVLAGFCAFVFVYLFGMTIPLF